LTPTATPTPPASDQGARRPARDQRQRRADARPACVAEQVAADPAEEESEDEAARRTAALDTYAARIVPPVELGEYAERLARQNAWLVSPFGELPLTSSMITFGYLGDYGPELAFLIRGESGVAQLGTRHYGLDLHMPGLPDGGRGAPVHAPFAGTIIRTWDPHGGPFGIWLDNSSLNLRARIMHMDGLVVGIETGARVQAGEQLGILGAQGTEGSPHLHLSFERLSDGAKINPALFYRLRDSSDLDTFASEWYDDPRLAPAAAPRLYRAPAANPEDPEEAAVRPDRPRPAAITRWGPFELPEP
jgi:murein DD-endopeptidase MepM/ murein hydrolase activator NlpD